MANEKMTMNAVLASVFGQALALDRLTYILASAFEDGNDYQSVERILRFRREAGREEIGKFVAENREYLSFYEAEARRIILNYEEVFDRALKEFQAARKGQKTVTDGGAGDFGFLGRFDDIGALSFPE